jgi:regulator of sigma E protease
VGRIGVSQQYVYCEHKPGEALGQSLVHSQRVAVEALTLVWSFVVGPNPAAEPPSSVAVVRQSSGAASTGMDSFLRVLVAISVALALLHLVPVPGLDGGRLVFLALELARGRPVPPRIETLANTVGFLAIAAIIVGMAVAEVRRALPSGEPPGTSGTGMVSDGGRSTPDAGGTGNTGSAPDGGNPPSTDGGPTGPGGAPDAGGPPRDADAGDAG